MSTVCLKGRTSLPYSSSFSTCGMALGHADPDEPATNRLQTVREPVNRFARFSGF